MPEKRIRSASKSLIWRLTSVLILAVVTYAYTRCWITTSLVTVMHHGAFLVIFYFHERLWLKVDMSLKLKSVLKMLTYETLLGNVVLGAITYLVTGDAKTMTVVTLTYIGIKHVMYVANEFVWDRVRWAK